MLVAQAARQHDTPASLRGQAVFITDAASGLGAAQASTLARAGADIVAADIRPQALTAAVAQWRAAGVRVHPIGLDVADPAASRRAIEEAAAYHASTWGLLGLSHALHAELRPQNIRVTAVAAGGMRTPCLLERFPELDPAQLQDPANVAEAIRAVLCMPPETVVAELTVLPMRQTSWP